MHRINTSATGATWSQYLDVLARCCKSSRVRVMTMSAASRRSSTISALITPPVDSSRVAAISTSTALLLTSSFLISLESCSTSFAAFFFLSLRLRLTSGQSDYTYQMGKQGLSAPSAPVSSTVGLSLYRLTSFLAWASRLDSPPPRRMALTATRCLERTSGSSAGRVCPCSRWAWWKWAR